MKKGIVIGGIVILVGIATPYFFGNAIENKFDDQVQKFQVALKKMDSGITLEKTEYSKGWLSSNSKTLLTIDHLQIPLEHKITHGPWGYFGLGKIETSFVLNDKQKQTVDSLFDGKQPLLITTNVGFSGYKSFDIYSAEINNKPAPTDPTMMINWGGMTGNLKLNGNRLITDIKIPKFTLTNTRIRKSVEILDLTVTGDNAYSCDKENLQAINWAGNAALNIEKVFIQSPRATFSSKIAVNAVSTDNNAHLGYNTTVKLTNIVVPKNLGITIIDSDLLELGIGFNGIPKQPLIDFINKLDDTQQQGKTSTNAEVWQLGEAFIIAVLQDTPSITAHALMTSKQGDANINAEAKLITPDTSTSNLSDLGMGIINRLEVTVAPNFSESLLDEAINKGQLPISKDQFIIGITEKNRFILNNGKFAGKFEYRQGQFYSNGQPDPELQYNMRYMLPRGIF